MTIEQIQVLFDQERYVDAHQACVDAIKEHAQEDQVVFDQMSNAIENYALGSPEHTAAKEEFDKIRKRNIPFYIMMEKCVISELSPHLNTDPFNKKEFEHEELLTNPARWLQGCVDDIDLFFEIDAEFRGHIERCKEKCQRALLTNIEKDTSVKSSYLNASFASDIAFNLDFAWLCSDHFNSLVQEKYSDLDTLEKIGQFRKKHRLPPTYKYDGDPFLIDKYQAAKRHFENVKIYHQNHRNSQSEDQMMGVFRVISENLMACDLLLEEKTGKNVNPAILAEHLKLKAEIAYFELTACLGINGAVISMNSHQGRREKDIKELTALQEKILALDPSYEPFPTPSAEPVNTSTQSSGGCYVATAVYGSYDCPQVWTLRRYRDYTLAKTWYGRSFIKTYYAISPTLVKWFGHTEWFKKMWQGKLDRLVARLQATGVESTPYKDKEW